ncbi:unnamed protein product [Ambrosiozyma monospora]|uniref:Unnamed protein product n=1 Tax=Ambrosiozyma monospora TaxID=43982 RepID=A0A9W7DK71_AMBMO|nr:unnamed protein product [Ambrosiozyma monospora]
MEITQIKQSLDVTSKLLKSTEVTKENQFEEALRQTAIILAQTASTNISRQLLSTSKDVWYCFESIIDDHNEYLRKHGVEKTDEFILRTRLVRGCVLLARNVSVGYNELMMLSTSEVRLFANENNVLLDDVNDVKSLYVMDDQVTLQLTSKYIEEFITNQNNVELSSILMNAIVSNLQFLSNLTAVKFQIKNYGLIFEVLGQFNKFKTNIPTSQLFNVSLPLIRFTNNIYNDEEFVNLCLKTETMKFSDIFTTYFVPMRDIALTEDDNGLSEEQKDQVEVFNQ